MQADRMGGRPSSSTCRVDGSGLTRIPEGHMRERERNLIVKLMQQRVTRQEGGRVRLQEYLGPPTRRL